jgi:hypothetical protein
MDLTLFERPDLPVIICCLSLPQQILRIFHRCSSFFQSALCLNCLFFFSIKSTGSLVCLSLLLGQDLSVLLQFC